MKNDNYLKKELYELIRADESIFDFIQESSLDGLWYWDLENPENEWMNPKFWTVLGYNPDEMPHKSSAWQNIINQDDLKVAIDNFTKHCENPNHPYDQIVRYSHKNGSTIWIRCRGLAIRDKYGKAVRMLGAHQDISDIKNREQELIKANEMFHASEKKLKSILDNMLDLVAITDLRGNFKFAGKSHKILGYEIEYLIGKNVMDFVHPDDIRGVQAKFADFITNQNPSANAIYRNRCANGSYLWFETIGTLILDNDGNSKEIIFNTRNITERKEIELLLQEKNEEIAAQNEEMAAQNEEIAAQNEEMTVQNEELNQANQKLIAAKEKAEESEEKLKEAQRIAHMGNWELNIETNVLLWSDEIYRIFDCEPQEFQATYEAFLEFIHPDDREKVNSAYLNSLETKKAYQIEHRVITKNNQIKFVLEKCTTTFNEQGKPLNSIGIVIDITEQKSLENAIIKAKEKAEENEAKLIEAQELSHVGSWEYFVDTDSINWSKEMFNVFELSNDMPAPKYSEQSPFYTEESFTKLDKAVQDCIRDEIPYEIELDIITSSGAIKQIISKGNVIKDKNNKLIGCYGTAQDITERKIIERELVKAKEKAEESEEKYRALFIHAPLSYQSLDENGCFIDINPMWSKTLGYEKDKIIGKWFGDFLHPDYVEHFRKNFPAFKKRGYVSDIEFRLRRKDNTYIYVSFEGCVGYTPEGKFKQTYCVFKDITEQKALENALIKAKEKAEESEAQFRLIYENSINPIMWTEAKTGKIIACNPASKILTEYDSQELIGQSFTLMIPQEQFTDTVSKYQTHQLNKKTKSITSQIITKSGKIKHVELSATNIEINGKEISQAIFIDITDLIQKEKELIAAKEKAEESDRLKSAFLANMSHEIRTPMNGIFGFAQLLKEPDLTGDEQQEYIKIIEKSGKRMLNIINDIVDISKIEAGLMKLDIIETNINEQIKYIHTFFKPEAENKGIKLSYKIALPEEEANIATDREKVIAVLTNLVKNAIKYTEKGSIEFGYNVIESKHTKYLKFYVKDTGIGINKDRQEAIFERFIQAEITDRKARQGAGLGLSISKAYVEMLGGKFLLESEEGLGSTFYFTLPYQLEPSKETNEWQPEPSEKSDDVRKLKILIAEDDEVSEILLENALKMFGKVILKAKSGVEAIELCRDNPDTDLIMMDIQMPEMNGYEATKHIREFNKEVIIIAQTAYGLSGDREKAIEAGCNDYIAKPFNKTELQALVKNYF